ncbi:MAG TPA: adenylyl-sulfate kinase [Vicinamibacterales bacterium]
MQDCRKDWQKGRTTFLQFCNPAILQFSKERNKRMTGRVAWFTGLSGAGKSTIAELAATMLRERDQRVAIIDGDTVRAQRHRHLGFSPSDIRENNRLIVELCREALASHDVILVPIISPFRDARDAARRALGEAFVEVHVKASLTAVARRDPKGLYRQAAEGRLPGLIGLSPEVQYEAPVDADVVLDTESSDPRACAATLVAALSSGDLS